MTEATLDTPVKAPTFTRSAPGARSRIASPKVLFTVVPDCGGAAGVAALHSHRAGFTAIMSSTWWTKSLAGVLPGAVRRRRLPRDLRHDRPGVDRGGDRRATGRDGGRLPGRVRPGPVRQGDDVHGRHSGRRAVDRGRAVHLALWIATLGFQQSAFAVSLALVLLMLPVVVRNTEEMLQAGSRRTPRSVLRAGHPEMEDHRCGSSCPPRCPASSAASCWRWPG